MGLNSRYSFSSKLMTKVRQSRGKSKAENQVYKKYIDKQETANKTVCSTPIDYILLLISLMR